MHDNNGYLFGMHFLWWILVIVVVLILYYTIKLQGRRIQKESSLEILKKRLAKGEITKEEFEESKKALEN